MGKQSFGTLNWLVLIAYLIVMLLIGLSFSKKSSKNSQEFFKATESKVPAWAVGFSIFATTLSAITYMSTPEKSFLTDWAYGFGNLAIFLIAPILIKFYIPFFSKLHVTTAYEYLEFRFNPFLRVFSSILFVLFHIGRIAIVIYLPTVALQSVISINPYLIAALITILCIIYTYHGGMEGVIWSDVIQGILLLVGAVLIISFAVAGTHGGWGSVASDAVEKGKILTKSSFVWSVTKSTVPIILLGQIFNTLYQYTASQDVVQRYTTSTDNKHIAKSIWTNALLSLITIPLFYGMGTVIYSFYNHGGHLPGGFNTSALVPYFVLTEIPAGVAGLIIAAIFAASQATIASSLNSTAACLVTDIQKRFMKDKSDKMSMRITHWSIMICGLFGLLVTLMLIHLRSSDMIDTYLGLFGLFGVPIAGIFALGILSHRANGFGATAGLIVTTAICYVIQLTGTNALFVSVIGFLGAMILGYLFSFLKPGHKKDITGLTFKTINENVDRRTMDVETKTL
ncbi:sodium:solute symporter [uncultured Secundilactobacillus sp.]|uniref:sodium:solute symporter n=1 Tax=uncultured Secundilactobacillus sp. TaxID=2813935 RepID=UPI00258BFDFD|nr:sodium:solute symporter [uncultured Secundilactobacillus sp.]